MAFFWLPLRILRTFLFFFVSCFKIAGLAMEGEGAAGRWDNVDASVAFAMFTSMAGD